MSNEAIVRLRGPDGGWRHLGIDTAARGVTAEGLTCSANEHGSDTCAFSLKRSPKFTWPDLLPFAHCEIEIAGAVVWGGRVWETPGQDGTGKSLNVQGRGWQSHLDDDLISRLYVLADMGRYVDQRSKATAVLGTFRTAPQVQSGDGVITLMYPSGFVVVTGDGVGVTADFGAALAKRVVITWERVGVSNADNTLYSRGSTSEAANTAGDDSSAVLSGASGTIAHTFAAARRYHHMMNLRTGAGGTYGSDTGVRISAVKVFGETAYESGNASILKASDVFLDVLASGALPLLNPSTALIAPSSFSIPEYAPAGSITPREYLTAVNAYHDNLWGVTPDRRLYFKERPTVATLETGVWAGAEYSDAGGGADEMRNKVLVSYTAPDGSTAEEEVLATSGLLNRYGFTRAARLNVGAAITDVAAEQLGAVWLAEKGTPSLKGSLNLKGPGAVRTVQGIGLDPAHLLLRAGEKIRLTHRYDANGGIGLDGTIRSVTYTHASRSASVALDQERGRFDALLTRLGIVQGAIR